MLHDETRELFLVFPDPGLEGQDAAGSVPPDGSAADIPTVAHSRALSGTGPGSGGACSGSTLDRAPLSDLCLHWNCTLLPFLDSFLWAWASLAQALS